MEITKYLENSALLIRELKGKKDFVTLEFICKRFHLSLNFTQKLAKKMKEAGYMELKRGRNGGARLIKEDITLKDIYLLYYPVPITNLQTRYVESLRTIDL